MNDASWLKFCFVKSQTFLLDTKHHQCCGERRKRGVSIHSLTSDGWQWHVLLAPPFISSLHLFIWAPFQGTVWYSIFKWPIVANLTSSLGYTASSLGNHELDDGVDDLVAYLRDTRNAYPTLSCNLELENEPGKSAPVRRSVSPIAIALRCTGRPDSMSHMKWRETKQQLI